MIPLRFFLKYLQVRVPRVGGGDPERNKKICIFDRQDKLRAKLSKLEPLSDEWANCCRELLQVTTERAELSKEEDVYEYTYTYVSSAMYQDFYSKGAG